MQSHFNQSDDSLGLWKVIRVAHFVWCDKSHSFSLFLSSLLSFSLERETLQQVCFVAIAGYLRHFPSTSFDRWIGTGHHFSLSSRPRFSHFRLQRRTNTVLTLCSLFSHTLCQASKCLRLWATLTVESTHYVCVLCWCLYVSQSNAYQVATSIEATLEQRIPNK